MRSKTLPGPWNSFSSAILPNICAQSYLSARMWSTRAPCETGCVTDGERAKSPQVLASQEQKPYRKNEGKSSLAENLKKNAC